MKRILGVLAIWAGLVLCATSAYGQSFKEAIEAYRRGDYETAARGFKAFAQKGNAQAQHNLGFMYAKGQGVPKNYAKAVKWLWPAAEKGDTRAQVMIGVMHYEGRGVPKDYLEAYKWSSLAIAYAREEKVHKLAVKLRNSLEKRMTPKQIAEAQRQAAEWRPKK